MDKVCSPCLRGNHGNCTLGERCPCDCNPHTPSQPVARITSEVTTAVVWEDPPLKGASNCAIPPHVVAALKQHPKRWAKVKVYKSKTGANGLKNMIIKGKIPTLPDHHLFECTARSSGEGSVLYIRFLGVK